MSIKVTHEYGNQNCAWKELLRERCWNEVIGKMEPAVAVVVAVQAVVDVLC